MAHLLFRLKSYLSYWLEAVDEHSLHSPFFFDLYTTHIKLPPADKRFAEIESLRNKLLRDRRMIPVRDLGSGGQQHSQKRISDIARTSLSSPKYSAIFSGLINYFDSSVIIELGTSLGINTLYLAAKPGTVVTTFEGAPAIADIAALTFEFASANNIKVVAGNIDRTLPSFLQGVRRVDFAFVDANHRYEPTLQYCEWLMKKVHEKSVIIIDDIHYSPEMDKAWRTLKGHSLVYASADLFRCGILFFDPSLNKQHVILQV